MLYNLSRALSQTFAILLSEISVPLAIVTKAIVGMADFEGVGGL